MSSPASPISTRTLLIVALLIGFLGAALRIYPSASFQQAGFDENLYRFYVGQLCERGITSYPDLVEEYREYQKTLPGSILPPVRFLYIGTAALWSGVTGAEPLPALRQVACLFSILTLFLAFGFVLRIAGRGAALGVLALMCCSPLQLHMAQHAMVDGFFAFWALLALWLLWENLHRPDQPWLLAGYALALALMVLTKENAFFIYIALGAIIVANRWLKFGTVNRSLLLAMVVGPLFGVVMLAWLAGGFDLLIETYMLSAGKNFTLEYAIKTGDGPWYRYFLDLLLISPLVFLFALGEVFHLRMDRKVQLYIVAFIGVSLAVMVQPKYAMNLRYATSWDACLRLLAFYQICALFRSGPHQWKYITGLVAAFCLYDLRQYWTFFVQSNLYELVSEGLLRAVKILK